MRLRHLAEKGDKAARILQNFLEQPDRLLGTTLMGTNLFMVMASVISTDRGARFGVWGETLTTIAMTLLVLVFSEYLPKAWFQSRPLKRCRPFAIPLRWSALMLRPLINTVNWLTSWIIPSGGDTRTSRPLVSTKDEIDVLAQESAEHGTLSPRQRIMIRRVLELSGKKARDIMTPRDKMTVLNPHSTVNEPSGNPHIPASPCVTRMGPPSRGPLTSSMSWRGVTTIWNVRSNALSVRPSSSRRTPP
jgi:putative hemolysin